LDYGFTVGPLVPRWSCLFKFQLGLGYHLADGEKDSDIGNPP